MIVLWFTEIVGNFFLGVASIVAMRWIANPCYSGSIPLPLL